MRRRTLEATVLAAAALTSAVFILATYGPAWAVAAGNTTALQGVAVFLPLPVAFGLALLLPWWAALGAVLVLMLSLQLPGGFNPFLAALPGGAWTVGLILRDRARLASELERAARELRADSALLAEESVRYERARIARELHDIVAHCVSVMVVQAYAGERLLAKEPQRAAASFDNILDAAGQARVELRRLVELLDEDGTGACTRPLGAALEALRDRVAAAGLTVEVRVRGEVDDLPSPFAAALFRAAQEAVTNALKHAPGSPIAIDVERSADGIRVAVRNDVGSGSGHGGSMLRGSGGGFGLAGMRQRLEILGGTLVAGPDPEGGWLVEASVPCPCRPAMAGDGRRTGQDAGRALPSSEPVTAPGALVQARAGVSPDAGLPGGPTPPR